MTQPSTTVTITLSAADREALRVGRHVLDELAQLSAQHHDPRTSVVLHCDPFEHPNYRTACAVLDRLLAEAPAEAPVPTEEMVSVPESVTAYITRLKAPLIRKTDSVNTGTPLPVHEDRLDALLVNLYETHVAFEKMQVAFERANMQLAVCSVVARGGKHEDVDPHYYSDALDAVLLLRRELATLKAPPQTLSSTHGDEMVVLTRTEQDESHPVTEHLEHSTPVLDVKVQYRHGGRKRPIRIRCNVLNAQLLYEAVTVLTARPSAPHTKKRAGQVLADLRDALTAKMPAGYPKQVGHTLPL